MTDVQFRASEDKVLGGSATDGSGRNSDSYPIDQCGAEVHLETLKMGVAPRVSGISDDHVRALCEQADSWPPILVTRGDLIVVDGQHRVAAAKRLGRSTIRCEFVEVDSDEVFAEAVRSNVRHGLALSMKDRKHAATVLLRGHSEWADRRIAETCGLSHHTVATLREATRQATGQFAQSERREGRDGRWRRVGPLGAGRSDLAAPPEVAGSSDQRRRHKASRRDDSVTMPVPPRSANGAGPGEAGSAATDLAIDSRWLLDPALRATKVTSTFAEWYARTSPGSCWDEFVEAIPISRIYEVSDEARARSAAWSKFAEMVERRVRRK